MPSSFTKELVVIKQKNGKWKTFREFRYYVDYENSPDYIDVPEGFETDFASVPRGLWNIFPPDGLYTQAAVLHDYLYHQRGNHTRTRKECDGIFLEAMGVLGTPWWKRHLMYRAVRLFGGAYWNKKSDEETAVESSTVS